METEANFNQDERLLAALCHIGIMLPMWGLILSGLVWATQREKSGYVRQQGIQAIAWQISLIVMILLGMGCYVLSFFGIFTTLMATNPSEPPAALVVPFATMGLLFLLTGVFMVTGIWATVRAVQGRPFTYPVVGGWVQRSLGSG